MLRWFSSGAFTVAMVITLASPAAAITITIGASKDATIFQNNVNNSNGAGPGIFAGNNGMNSPRHGLIAFDIAGNIPTGATITAVQLTLYLGQVAGSGGTPGSGDQTPRTIGLYELTNDWGEGTTGSGSTMIGGTGQGFPATPGDATWNARFFSGMLWTTLGGDHDTTASASLTVSSVVDAPYTWLSTPALVDDVQGWLNTPSTNFGWELINLEESTPQDFRSFYTSEFSNSALRPQLQIIFAEPVPEPASIVLFALGIFCGFPLMRRMTR